MSHTCPHPACTEQVGSTMLACRPHWFALPAELRSEVWAAYRRIRSDPRRHRAAIAACLTWWRANA